MEKVTIEQIQAQIERVRSDEVVSLTGSVKQVAWAEKIRAGYLGYIRTRIANYEQAGALLNSGLPTDLENALFHLKHEKASYWIDERNDLK